MRDNFARFEAAGVAVFGVNPASPEAHDRYIAKFGFPFPILSDTDKNLAKAFGAIKALGLIQRSVFVVDAGVIRFAKAGMPRSDEILKALST